MLKRDENNKNGRADAIMENEGSDKKDKGRKIMNAFKKQRVLARQKEKIESGENPNGSSYCSSKMTWNSLNEQTFLWTRCPLLRMEPTHSLASRNTKAFSKDLQTSTSKLSNQKNKKRIRKGNVKEGSFHNFCCFERSH